MMWGWKKYSPRLQTESRDFRVNVQDDRDEAAALQRKMFNIQYLSHELVGIVHVPSFAIKRPYFVLHDFAASVTSTCYAQFVLSAFRPFSCSWFPEADTGGRHLRSLTLRLGDCVARWIDHDALESEERGDQSLGPFFKDDDGGWHRMTVCLLKSMVYVSWLLLVTLGSQEAIISLACTGVQAR